MRQVWDALTGDELFELKHRKIVRAADWSADSTHIVTGGKEGVLRLYDVNRLEAEPRTLTLTPTLTLALALTLAISRPEAEPTMLEGHTPNSLIKVLPPRPPPTSHSRLFSRLPPAMERPPPRPRQVVKYVSSDSPTLFLSGGDDKTLRLWDTRTASEARHPTPTRTLTASEAHHWLGLG